MRVRAERAVSRRTRSSISASNEAERGFDSPQREWNWIAIRNLAAIIAFVIVFFIAAATSDGATGRPKFVSPFAWAVALCETQGDFNHNGGSYRGAWGWYVGTWQLDKRRGYPDDPTDATPRQQNRVFHDSLAKGRYFGCIAGGGYRSHL